MLITYRLITFSHISVYEILNLLKRSAHSAVAVKVDAIKERKFQRLVSEHAANQHQENRAKIDCKSSQIW